MQGSQAEVQYVDVFEDEAGSELLKEMVPVKLMRPVPTKLSEPLKSKVGDVVDARLPDDDGYSSIWWVCTVRKVDMDKKRPFQVVRKETGEKCWVPADKIRPSQSWCGGDKWVARGSEASACGEQEQANAEAGVRVMSVNMKGKERAKYLVEGSSFQLALHSAVHKS